MNEDNKRTCLRCGGELTLHKKGYVLMHSTDLVFVEEREYLEMYFCPACRHVEWFRPPTPYEEFKAEQEIKENMTPVEKFEYTFRDYSERQLQKVIDGRDYVDEAKKAAKNLLYKRKYGE